MIRLMQDIRRRRDDCDSWEIHQYQSIWTVNWFVGFCPSRASNDISYTQHDYPSCLLRFDGSEETQIPRRWMLRDEGCVCRKHAQSPIQGPWKSTKLLKDEVGKSALSIKDVFGYFQGLWPYRGWASTVTCATKGAWTHGSSDDLNIMKSHEVP